MKQLIPTKLPIVLCHGLYGFEASNQYWGETVRILRQKGVKVYTAKVHGTKTVEQRADELNKWICENVKERDINIVAHSMGGLDARFLITHGQTDKKLFRVRTLTTISTPHRGSPFMDWLKDIIGLGASNSEKAGLRWYSNLIPRLMSPLDVPAYRNLTSTYLNKEFNPSTPDDKNVEYFSFGANAGITELNSRGHNSRIWGSILQIPWEIVYSKEGENDGVVSAYSSRWGSYQGTVEADHFSLSRDQDLFLATKLPSYATPNNFFQKKIKSHTIYSRRMDKLYPPCRSFDEYIYGLEMPNNGNATAKELNFSLEKIYTEPQKRKEPFLTSNFYEKIVNMLSSRGY